MAPRALLAITILALAMAHAFAFDPSPLQDFCVADRNSTVFVNGLVCKDPKLAMPEDFFLSGLDRPGNTANRVGSNVTLINVGALPAGLNTLGISIARIDCAPCGLNPPHAHPRATEILTVLGGELYVGFVTSNPNRLFAKTLEKGDVFVFPIALIHFQFNAGEAPDLAIAGLSSQNRGVITIASAVFGSNPRILNDVLEKAFQVDKQIIEELMAQFNNYSKQQRMYFS